MKKIPALLLALFMLVGVFAGCGKQPDAAKTGKLKVVATIFPAYDWVLEILGDKADNAEITFLLDNGVELHSYQPTAEDIVKISTCDLFIYVGGESDRLVDTALKNTAGKNRKVLKLLEALGDAVKTEKTVEGMQEPAHDPANFDSCEHPKAPEYDEHVWLSLKNAAILVKAVCESLQALDPDNADVYAANGEAYMKKLSALDGEYRKAVDGATGKTLLFGDRFPFRYMAEDYGLRYYAAFAGCSAETEAGFETISFLAKKVDEMKLPCVLTIEGSQHKIAQAVVQATAEKNQTVLTMNSMQSTTSKDLKAGTTYLSVMEKNLSVLKEALR